MKRYKVKEMADLLGMTTQTLRRYESLGIIAPARDEENSYRTYQTLDFMQLMRLKGLRGYGLGLKESCQIYDHDIAGVANAFAEQADALAAEIERLKAMEHQARLQHARLKDCEELTHIPFRTEMRPALKAFLYMDTHDLGDYSRAKKGLGTIMEFMPPMRSCVLYPQESLPSPEYKYGLCAFDHELTDVPSAQLEQCVSYPPVFCLTTVIQSTGVSTAASAENSAVTSGQLRVEKMLRMVAENNYELVGDIIGEIHHMWKEVKDPAVPVQHRFHNYIKMWIPVRPLSP